MPLWTGVSFTNPKGRLVLTCTNTLSGTCTGPATATAYSYDQVGRTNNFWQCNPSNCGASTIWNTPYAYDWAGDVNSWVNPDTTYSATLTNTVNAAQQITAVQSSKIDGYHPQNLALITYTAWGAVSTLENGCAGSGCSNTQETYTYNKRLQPIIVELGLNGGNLYSDYCYAYNYYADKPNPTSCAAPAQGTKNNGNVLAYWYQDNFQTGFSHTASYNFDNVNRLTGAVATGNSTYNQSYGYTADGTTGQYGNMTCTSGCANMPASLTFSANTNQITSANYTYDAAGDLTADASNSTTHTYQWDAEGRVSKVDSGTTWTFTYDAVGDRVAWVSGGVTYDHLFDPAGNWLGVAGSYSIIMQGGRPLVVYNSAETWFHHVNNIDSRTFMTNHFGTPTQDMTFYPWGDLWQSWGGGGLEFADLPYRDPNTTTDLTTYRLFSPNLGRWHSPDPLGGDITNPQTLNRYAYVLNDPTSLIDPMGLGTCPNANPAGTNGQGQTIYSTCNPQQAAQSNLTGLGGSIYRGVGITGWGLGGLIELGNWGTIEPVFYTSFAFIDTNWFTVLGGGRGGGGTTVNYFKLVLTWTQDTCDWSGRTVQYQLYDTSGNPVTSPEFYVYEVLSSSLQSLAKGGPFPGTTYQANNKFTDFVTSYTVSGSGTQQFGVSLQQPNASGVPGGHLIPILGPGRIQPAGQNNINLSPGNPVINGTSCH